jgi:hypothetical protein
LGQQVTSPSSRLSVTTKLTAASHDMRTVQELPDPADVSTSSSDTQMPDPGGRGMRSPLDRLGGKAPGGTGLKPREVK